MKKIKISLFALAFAFAAGAATVVNADPIPGKWYAPSYPASTTALDAPPAGCGDGVDLCATRYDEFQQPDGFVNLPL